MSLHWGIQSTVCNLNECDLLQVTKTFNLHNNNLASKDKRYLKKIIEKYYEDDLSEDGNLLMHNVSKWSDTL